jgi:hypothetical protein
MHRLSRRGIATPESLVAIAALIFALAACAVRLAPDYDKRIVDGLSAANEEMMTFFAAVSAGTTAASYSQREPRYNAIIGKLDAMKVQSQARPVPASSFVSRLGVGPASTESQPASAPTTSILATMSETVTKMRDTDKRQGITAVEVAAFKGSFVISMSQALTYENALQR